MSPNDVMAVLAAFLAVVGVALVAGGILALVLRLRAGEPFTIPLRLLLRIYLYLVVVASLLVMVSGLADLVRAGLGAGLGLEFSYRPAYVAPAPIPVPDERGKQEPSQEEMEQQRREGLSRSLREGLVRGISFALVGGLIWSVHSLGRRRLETPAEAGDLLNRLYLIALLVVFSILTLVSLPTGLFEALRYYLLEQGESRSTTPGSPLSTAIVALPFWTYYLNSTVRSMRRPAGG